MIRRRPLAAQTDVVGAIPSAQAACELGMGARRIAGTGVDCSASLAGNDGGLLAACELRAGSWMQKLLKKGKADTKEGACIAVVLLEDAVDVRIEGSPGLWTLQSPAVRNVDDRWYLQ